MRDCIICILSWELRFLKYYNHVNFTTVDLSSKIIDSPRKIYVQAFDWNQLDKITSTNRLENANLYSIIELTQKWGWINIVTYTNKSYYVFCGAIKLLLVHCKFNIYFRNRNNLGLCQHLIAKITNETWNEELWAFIIDRINWSFSCLIANSLRKRNIDISFFFISAALVYLTSL